MRITVELFDLARHLTKKEQVELDIHVRTRDVVTLQDVAVALCESTPELLGRVLNPETKKPMDTYAFNLNGRYITQNLNTEVKEGDRVILMTVVGGG